MKAEEEEKAEEAEEGEKEGEEGGEKEERLDRALELAPHVHLYGNLTMINSDVLIAHMWGWWGGRLETGVPRFVVPRPILLEGGDGGGSRQLKGWGCANTKPDAIASNTNRFLLPFVRVKNRLKQVLVSP